MAYMIPMDDNMNPMNDMMNPMDDNMNFEILPPTDDTNDQSDQHEFYNPFSIDHDMYSNDIPLPTNHNDDPDNQKQNRFTIADELRYIRRNVKGLHLLYFQIPPPPRNPVNAIYKLIRLVRVSDIMNFQTGYTNQQTQVFFYKYFSPDRLYNPIGHGNEKLPTNEPFGFHILQIPSYAKNQFYYYLITRHDKIIYSTLERDYPKAARSNDEYDDINNSQHRMFVTKEYIDHKKKKMMKKRI